MDKTKVKIAKSDWKYIWMIIRESQIVIDLMGETHTHLFVVMTKTSYDLIRKSLVLDGWIPEDFLEVV